MYSERTFPELLTHRAHERGDKIFFSFKGTDYTYEKTYELSCRIAVSLRQLGIQKGDHVVVALPNVPENILSLAGISMSGAVFIPANANFTEREIVYLIENSEAKGIIGTPEIVEKVRRHKASLPDLTFMVHVDQEGTKELLSWDTLVKGNISAYHAPEVLPEDLLMIIYTSGTTGDPKGAMIAQGRFLNNANRVADLFRMTPEDISVNMLPYNHIFAPIIELIPALGTGSRFILRENFHPRGVLEDVQKYRATLLAGVPPMYATMLDEMENHDYELSSLRVCLIAAAPVPQSVQQGFEKKTGCTMIQGYGQTEAGPLVLFEPVDRPEGLHPGTCGKTLFDDIRIRLVDEEGNNVPQGEIGEILVHSPDIMLGYWKIPEQTARTIEPDGWLHTGDLAYADKDGYYYMVDRLKHMIISSGRNIYPAEIENVLVSIPEVKEAAVLGIPDELRGEAVEAFVVLKEPGTITEKDILDYCRQYLTAYKVPRKLHIVESFPHTVSGKIRKVQFREEYLRNQTNAG